VEGFAQSDGRNELAKENLKTIRVFNGNDREGNSMALQKKSMSSGEIGQMPNNTLEREGEPEELREISQTGRVPLQPLQHGRQNGTSSPLGS